MKVVYFTNCQGEIIHKILMKCLAYKKLIRDYKYIPIYAEKDFDNFFDVISNCDVFIYQPYKNNDYCTLLKGCGALKFLKDNCIKICIPSIINDCFPIVENNGKYWGEDFIHKLINNGLTLDKIIALYINKNLDFDLPNRYAKSINHLKENEKYCDIKISDVMIQIQKNENVFYTHNHPKEKLLAIVANCILIKLSINETIPIDNIPTLYENTSVWPLDYSMKTLGFDYIKNENVNQLYIHNIQNVYCNYMI